jgi:hypothetical protein
MTELKLAKLPDRTPVKLAITITPDLQNALRDYAAIYAQTYGTEEPVADLIPAMLAAFLESDRNFIRARDARSRENG